MGEEKTIRRVITTFFAIATIVSGSFLIEYSSVFSTVAQIWRGYYTLVVYKNQTASFAPVFQYLEETFTNVVSAHNAEEQITNFSGQESINVKGIRDRLDNLDPRLDSYLRNVGNWFVTAVDLIPADIIYVETSLPPISFYASLSLPFAGNRIPWDLADLPKHEGVLALVLFIMIIITEIGFYDSSISRWSRFLLSVPWTYIVVNGGMTAAFIAIPSYVFIVKFVGKIMNNRCEAVSSRKILLELSFLSLLGLIGVAVNTEGLSILVDRYFFLPFNIVSRMGFYFSIGLGWSLSIVSITLIVNWLAAAIGQKQTLTKMIPNPLPRACDHLAVRMSASLTICLIGFCVIVPVVGGQAVPRPIPFSDPVLLRLDSLPTISNPNTSHLPTLSDYIAHVVYQETLEYGRPYRLPVVGERVVLDHYQKSSDGDVVREKRQIIQFSDQWLKSKLRSIKSNSISSLLVAQDKPIMVQSRMSTLFTEKETIAWIVLVMILSISLARRKYNAH